MSALGETFRAARESQGLSLSDVADRLHIRSVYLAAIEAEDWQAIGPAVYARGFVRSYARCLGLDPDAALASFGVDPSTGPAAPSVVLAPSPRGEPSRSGLPRGEVQKRGPSVWAVLGLVVASALLVVVAYEYFAYRSGSSLVGHPGSPQAVGTPAQMTRRQIASAEMPTRAVAPELYPAAKNAIKSNEIAIRIQDQSWLRVIVDGKVEMEGLFATGTSRTFAGRSVTIRVGNAGGVDLSVGGKDLGPMGGLGDVAERSFQL